MICPVWLMNDMGECDRFDSVMGIGVAGISGPCVGRGVMFRSTPLPRLRVSALVLAVGDSEGGSGEETSREESLGSVDCREVEADVVGVGDETIRVGGCLSAAAVRGGTSGGEGRVCMTFRRSLFVRTAVD